MRLMLYNETSDTEIPIEDGGTIRTESDRSMSDRAFYLDAYLIEHSEMDCGDGMGRCLGCRMRYEALDEIHAEQERRRKLGLYIRDADEPTLEERWWALGENCQEQRERGRVMMASVQDPYDVIEENSPGRLPSVDAPVLGDAART